MSGDITSYAYLFSAICFVLAIRGLASPETARTGNLIGILGIAVAVGATMLLPQISTWLFVFVGIVLGGAIGAFIALKVKITDLPQLVAIFNSLVGLAADGLGDWLAGRLAARMAGWPGGWSTEWLAGRLARRLAGRLAGGKAG